MARVLLPCCLRALTRVTRCSLLAGSAWPRPPPGSRLRVRCSRVPLHFCQRSPTSISACVRALACSLTTLTNNPRLAGLKLTERKSGLLSGDPAGYTISGASRLYLLPGRLPAWLWDPTDSLLWSPVSRRPVRRHRRPHPGHRYCAGPARRGGPVSQRRRDANGRDTGGGVAAPYARSDTQLLISANHLLSPRG